MGSSNNSAQNEANRVEAERQAEITAATQAINDAYDDPKRQTGYDDFLKAVRENYTEDANRQKTVTDRDLKFSMARSGLTGGSAQVDANRTAGEEYQRGILQAEDLAQGALGDLKNTDEQSRLSLISMAQSGLDATTAASRAASAASSSAGTALANTNAKGLGDIFGQTVKTVGAQQEAAAERRGARTAGTSLYGSTGWGR